MDNLTASAIAIVIILIIVVILLTKQRIDTDRKLNRMAKQFSLMQYNEKAKAYCKRMHEKYPDLCAGTDFFLKEKGDDVVIEEWNSDQPRPDR
jgi:signal transduction histidine kinase